jgi:hypothetical protein
LVAEYARVVASALQHPRHQRLREIFHWLQFLLREAGLLARRLDSADLKTYRYMPVQSEGMEHLMEAMLPRPQQWR